jgi:hypothetical protein
MSDNSVGFHHTRGAPSSDRSRRLREVYKKKSSLFFYMVRNAYSHAHFVLVTFFCHSCYPFPRKSFWA